MYLFFIKKVILSIVHQFLRQKTVNILNCNFFFRILAQHCDLSNHNFLPFEKKKKSQKNLKFFSTNHHYSLVIVRIQTRSRFVRNFFIPSHRLISRRLGNRTGLSTTSTRTIKGPKNLEEKKNNLFWSNHIYQAF